MRPARQGRTFEAVSASIVAHVILLSALLAHMPTLRMPRDAGGPPEAIIPVLILPRTPPAVDGAPPKPVRLHRRRLRTPVDEEDEEELPVAPLYAPPAAPEAAPAEAAQPADPWRVQGDPFAANIRNALRGSRVGCANAEALGLSREERERCQDQFAAGAKDAPFTGLDQSSPLARAAARKEAYREYRDGGVPPGTTSGGAGDSGQPWKVVIPPTRP